ncbi:MAG: 2-hydroxymuconic semialdehyde dehydrogenase [Gammaproteobacteria bacterium]|nr:2-hydroxymuconic semialdehyde dehydrogenase [Gammaproteobacteria bacterium]
MATSSSDLARRAAGEMLNFIDGEFVRSADGGCFETFDPTCGQPYASVHAAGEAEVDRAVRAARDALDGPWGKLTVAERSALLFKLAARINERFEEFLVAECLDTGKPHALARHIDIPRGAANFTVFADLVRNVPTESYRMETPDGAGALNYGVRRPKGVIAVICPWNLPLLLMTWKVGPALACGNTVVVKPSEETPATATLLGEVMNEVGIPPGVYNVVNGFGAGSTGEFLTRHPQVDAITFTGETVTGTAIMQNAAVGIRDVSFELGGKNAGVVFADADFDAAVDGISRAAFANCGQVCLGTERVYVERPIFERFVEALKARAEGLKIGLPAAADTGLGPMVSSQQRDKVLGYYERARALGATVVTGGGVPDMPHEQAGGYWIEPTIWTGLAEESPIVREEIFGPCCHLRPFDDEDEVVALANATDYGLCTTIWTQHAARAHRVAERIDVGITWVNCWFLRDLRTSFGGARQSGIGREGGVHSLEFYTELRNVCIKL